MACVILVSFITFRATVNFRPAGRSRARPFPPDRDARTPLIRSKASSAPPAKGAGDEPVMLSL
jgi:hypothetical protein